MKEIRNKNSGVTGKFRDQVAEQLVSTGKFEYVKKPRKKTYKTKVMVPEEVNEAATKAIKSEE